MNDREDLREADEQGPRPDGASATGVALEVESPPDAPPNPQNARDEPPRNRRLERALDELQRAIEKVRRAMR